MYLTFFAEGVYKLVNLEIDIRGIPPDDLEGFKERGTGSQMFYKIPYQIEIKIRSGSVGFALVCGDIRYEATKVEFIKPAGNKV